MHANLTLCEDSLKAHHLCVIATGDTRRVGVEAYSAGLKQGVSDDDLIATCHYLQQERVRGRKRFQAMAEKMRATT